MSGKTLEVCFSPLLYPVKSTQEDFITVVVDVLRATTSICEAFKEGVREIIPVASVKEADTYKREGMLVAGEAGGEKLTFADFGNSPFDFRNDRIKGKSLVFRTTNGTKSILMARDANMVLLGSFLNIGVLGEYLVKSRKNVVILCSGWNGQFSLEDAVCAGAIAEKLTVDASFDYLGDSVYTARKLWNDSAVDLAGKMKAAEHAQRLQKLGLGASHKYTFTQDRAAVLPALKNDKLFDLLKETNTNL